MERNYNVTDLRTGDEWRWYDTIGSRWCLIRRRPAEPDQRHYVLPIEYLADQNQFRIERV